MKVLLRSKNTRKKINKSHENKSGYNFQRFLNKNAVCVGVIIQFCLVMSPPHAGKVTRGELEFGTISNDDSLVGDMDRLSSYNHRKEGECP